MKSRFPSFLEHKEIGKILLTSIVLIFLTVMNVKINSTDGFMQLTDEANSTLQELDKNLTSAMISLAINQINASAGPDNEESSTDLAMAQSTLHDLMEGLEIKSEKLSLSTSNPNDHELCRKQSYTLIDCIIGDVRFAQESLNDGRPDMATEILETILKNVT
jgi:hypothetical protein